MIAGSESSHQASVPSSQWHQPVLIDRLFERILVSGRQSRWLNLVWFPPSLLIVEAVAGWMPSTFFGLWRRPWRTAMGKEKEKLHKIEVHPPHSGVLQFHLIFATSDYGDIILRRSQGLDPCRTHFDVFTSVTGIHTEEQEASAVHLLYFIVSCHVNLSIFICSRCSLMASNSETWELTTILILVLLWNSFSFLV